MPPVGVLVLLVRGGYFVLAWPHPKRPAGTVGRRQTARRRAAPVVPQRRGPAGQRRSPGRAGPVRPGGLPGRCGLRARAQQARRKAMRNEPTGTEDTFERRLGQRVRRAREAAGLTQSRLERDAGMPGATVARLERGEYDLPVSELADIAHVLCTDPGNLVPPIGDPEAGDRQ